MRCPKPVFCVGEVGARLLHTLLVKVYILCSCIDDCLYLLFSALIHMLSVVSMHFHLLISCDSLLV